MCEHLNTEIFELVTLSELMIQMMVDSSEKMMFRRSMNRWFVRLQMTQVRRYRKQTLSGQKIMEILSLFQMMTASLSISSGVRTIHLSERIIRLLSLMRRDSLPVVRRQIYRHDMVLPRCVYQILPLQPEVEPIRL